VQTASIAEKALSLVRDTRNTPATDSTSAAPPTVASADPLTVTWTVFPTNLLAAFPSGTPGLLGADGEDDEPLHAENKVASAAHDATWQASPQKRRREIGVSVSDICADPRRFSETNWARSGPLENWPVFASAETSRFPRITESGVK
jgi:hypothetical protein